MTSEYLLWTLISPCVCVKGSGIRLVAVAMLMSTTFLLLSLAFSHSLFSVPFSLCSLFLPAAHSIHQSLALLFRLFISSLLKDFLPFFAFSHPLVSSLTHSISVSMAKEQQHVTCHSVCFMVHRPFKRLYCFCCCVVTVPSPVC